MKLTIDSEALPWGPAKDGISAKPLHFFPNDRGWDLLLRVEPGTVVKRHRHTGEVHAFNLSGSRKLIETGEVVGPGGYVYEPAGNVDSWMAVGDEPAIVHVVVKGAVEYLDQNDNVIERVNATSAAARYRKFCDENGVNFDELFG
ncbi:MAG TPA: 2,4'-dihydroxyacetophenone dioxygenase family protein [Thermoanaerobaculia bacterium]|nr:2,4'-dihydroxyacetophenone dioxygenase family protein [Thermoanaerobaculia bacterium]